MTGVTFSTLHLWMIATLAANKKIPEKTTALPDHRTM
jgi:hypothetical protein